MISKETEIRASLRGLQCANERFRVEAEDGMVKYFRDPDCLHTFIKMALDPKDPENLMLLLIMKKLSFILLIMRDKVYEGAEGLEKSHANRLEIRNFIARKLEEPLSGCKA